MLCSLGRVNLTIKKLLPVSNIFPGCIGVFLSGMLKLLQCDSLNMLIEISEKITHSTVDLHLKEISEFPHGSVMDKTSHSNDP